MERVWKDDQTQSHRYTRGGEHLSRTHLLSPGMWVNIRRDAMTSVSLDSANVGPTFSVKELNPFDSRLDLVVLGEWPRRSVVSEEGQSPWRMVNFSCDVIINSHTAGYNDFRNEPDASKFEEIKSNIIVDLTQLHVDQLGLFNRLIEIADEVDNLKHVRINRIAFNHLINNLDEAVEEEE
ncbi:hypothetical protein G5I_04165 [Acromyrmex echinatior]|uniref:Uncharacterized protein n=1 Tax=Acromyrmex echinatior TaxID=103372 RepID=F4WEW4_ACREC|nr:hypothetical protein G5I_04165 [Acromyrmex echinatior]